VRTISERFVIPRAEGKPGLIIQRPGECTRADSPQDQ
jgi:hypothetical protein